MVCIRNAYKIWIRRPEGITKIIISILLMFWVVTPCGFGYFCGTSYEAPHYAVLSSLPSLFSLRSKYSSQLPVLKHPQSKFSP
jgi:hypothetical protein